MIGLLIEKQVTYTEAEAEALIAQAKRLAKESGRTVRAEAELLLRDRETRLRDLRSKVVDANKLLAAITVEVDDLRAPGHPGPTPGIQHVRTPDLVLQAQAIDLSLVCPQYVISSARHEVNSNRICRPSNERSSFCEHTPRI